MLRDLNPKEDNTGKKVKVHRFTVVDGNDVRFTVVDGNDVGFTVVDGNDVGFTVVDGNDVGFTVVDGNDVGFTVVDSNDVGFTVVDGNDVGFTVVDGIDVGFTVVEDNYVGFTVVDSNDVGFTVVDGIDVGFTVVDGNDVGFTVVDGIDVVADLLDLLGGLVAHTEAADLTMLLGNVTRMFGASPFFKVVVHSDKNVSLVSKVTSYVNPLTSPPDYSRSRTSTKQKEASNNQARLNELLLHLIKPNVNESEGRSIVAEFFRLEDNIRRILNTGEDQTEDKTITCDSQSKQNSMGELQVKYNVFGLDWFTFFQNVLDTTDVSDLKFCKVKLSNELQHLLKITPRTVLRQFIILHTLIHSDFFILISKNHQNIVQSPDGKELSETLEEQCLDLIAHFLPALEKYIGCDSDTLAAHKKQTLGTLRDIRSAMYSVLTSSLKITKDNAAVVTNSTVKPIIESLNEELVSRCQSGTSPQGTFDEYSFNSNMLRIIQYYHGEYFRGRLTKTSRDLELSALWIASSVQDQHRSRAGPIVYSSPVPLPIMYGSLGSFLASRVADSLGIQDILNHFFEGRLNDSTVLALALRLDCLALMYGQMDILDYGSQVYKVNGKKTKEQQWKDQSTLKLVYKVNGNKTKEQQWKDQLTLKLAYKAWQQWDTQVEADHFIPGLTFTRPQMFFIALAQTHCEKVSERGILHHYINNGSNPAIPEKQRVNGMLRNFDDFAEAFQCSDNMFMNPMDKCRLFG
ncbi:hypothetical protein Btru_068833 [Bulinus truncatus]|nr:hypothetical protein Btru_068833 [Bulinus truncatus]